MSLENNQGTVFTNAYIPAITIINWHARIAFPKRSDEIRWIWFAGNLMVRSNTRSKALLVRLPMFRLYYKSIPSLPSLFGLDV